MPRAAVCPALHADLEVVELALEPPRAGEVRVRIEAAGVCGSDLSVQHGHLPSPFPIVLGHEGAGIVVETGPEVASVSAGDHVAVCAMPQCGSCRRCARGQQSLCELGDGVLLTGGLLDGTPRFSTASGAGVHQMVATGTFATEVVVPAISVVRIDPAMPFVPAALLGCAVLTGAGAALNTADIRAGDTVVVLGCGSVGLSAVQGARLAGAERIVAVDLAEPKLELARRVGATDVVLAGRDDPIDAVAELTSGRGADVTIEAVGAQATVDQAIKTTGKGGEVVFVGAGSKEVRVDVRQFSGLVGCAKTFKGCLFGSAHTHHDVPRLVAHYLSGELELDALITRTFALGQINEGLAATAAGDVTSCVVELSDSAVGGPSANAVAGG